MKTKISLLLVFMTFYIVTEAQIKIFEDNFISIGSLQKYGHGIQLPPEGYAIFNPSIFGDYAWMNISNSTGALAKNWIVNWDDDHKFFVLGNGLIYTTRGMQVGSDTSLKKDIDIISDPIKKVLKLQGVVFSFKESDEAKDTIRFQDKQGNWHTILPGQSSNIDPSWIKEGSIERLLSDRSRKQMGLIAQAVDTVVPEVVRMTPNGTLAIEYCGLIGLLIEAIKEQQSQIDSLKAQKLQEQYKSMRGNSSNINEVKTGLKNGDSASEHLSTNIGNNMHFQNVPNPFTQNTEIRFKLAPGAKSALLLIFDMQGSLLQTYDVINSTDRITVFGNELKPGIYLYSLIVDGVETDTKRMILTK